MLPVSSAYLLALLFVGLSACPTSRGSGSDDDDDSVADNVVQVDVSNLDFTHQ